MKGVKWQRLAVLVALAAVIVTAALTPAGAVHFRSKQIAWRYIAAQSSVNDTLKWDDSSSTIQGVASSGAVNLQNSDTSEVFTLDDWTRWRNANKKSVGNSAYGDPATATVDPIGADSSLAFIYEIAQLSGSAGIETLNVTIQSSVSGRHTGAWETIKKMQIPSTLGDGVFATVNTIDTSMVVSAVSLSNKIAFPMSEKFRVITQHDGVGKFQQRIYWPVD